MPTPPTYQYQTGTAAPTGVPVLFTSDSAGQTPAAITDGSGNPINQSRWSGRLLSSDPATGAVPVVYGTAATVYVWQVAVDQATLVQLVATVTGRPLSTPAPSSVPLWAPNTFYVQGAYVLAPAGSTLAGQIVSANATFTSGATFSAANWTATLAGSYVNQLTRFRDAYTSKSAGSLAALDSGQGWATTGTAAPSILTGGKVGSASVGAGYFEPLAYSNPITHIGCVATFAAGTGTEVGTGALAMPVWQTPIHLAGGSVPNSGFHLAYAVNKCQVEFWSSNSPSTYSTVWYYAPIVEDDTTQYTLGASIDPVNGIAEITLPDGRVVECVDPRIASMAGAVPCWENYRPAATEFQPHFLEVWADDAA